MSAPAGAVIDRTFDELAFLANPDVSDISKVDESVAVDDYHRRGAHRHGVGGRSLVLFDTKIFPRWLSADSAGFVFSRNSRWATRH